MPTGKSKKRDEKKGVSHEVVEGGQQVKKHKAHDVDVLLGHVDRQVDSHADSWIASVDAGSGKRSLPSDCEGDDEGNKPTKRRKTYKIEDKAKHYKAMKASLQKLDDAETKADSTCSKAEVALKATKNTDYNDKVLISYIRALQSAWQVMNKWRGLDEVVTVTVPGPDHDVSRRIMYKGPEAGSATGAPSSSKPASPKADAPSPPATAAQAKVASPGKAGTESSGVIPSYTQDTYIYIYVHVY